MKSGKFTALIALLLIAALSLSAFAAPIFSTDEPLYLFADEESDAQDDEDATSSAEDVEEEESDSSDVTDETVDTAETPEASSDTVVEETAPAFVKTNTYGEIQPYNDVYADHWFYTSVANAYEYGLMFGKSKTVFGPNDTMTVAEAITIACRLNTIYYGRDAVTTSATGMWYDSYVSYAVENGIIADGDFVNYNTAVTRAEMARIFAKTLPAEWLNEINAVDAVPDVDKSNADYDAILMLYKAGICSGSDAQHNYKPETNIKRSEVAAIITRLADKSLRVTF